MWASQPDWNECLVGEEAWFHLNDEKETKIRIQPPGAPIEDSHETSGRVVFGYKPESSSKYTRSPQIAFDTASFAAPAASGFITPRLRCVSCNEMGDVAIGGMDGDIFVIENGVGFHDGYYLEDSWPRVDEHPSAIPPPEESSLLGHDRPWGLSRPSPMRKLDGHVGGITSLSWFPSNTVLLSSSKDMSMRVWNAQTGHCGAILRGHTSPITDTAYSDRGRKIYSCAKDGQIWGWETGRASKVWDVSMDESCVWVDFDEARHRVWVAGASKGLGFIDVRAVEEGVHYLGGVEEEGLECGSRIGDEFVLGFRNGFVKGFELTGDEIVPKWSFCLSKDAPITSISHKTPSKTIATSANGNSAILQPENKPILLSGAREPLYGCFQTTITTNKFSNPTEGAKESKSDDEDDKADHSAPPPAFTPISCYGTVGKEGILRLYREI